MRKALVITHDEADELATWLEELKERRSEEAKKDSKLSSNTVAIMGVIHALRSYSNGRDWKMSLREPPNYDWM